MKNIKETKTRSNTNWNENIDIIRLDSFTLVQIQDLIICTGLNYIYHFIYR
jgi:hypothetical protein